MHSLKTDQHQDEALKVQCNQTDLQLLLKPLSFLRRLPISISGKLLVNLVFSVLRPKPRKRHVILEERLPEGSRFPIQSRSLS